MDWFHYVREPKNSAREKLVMFLQDIFVVGGKRLKILNSSTPCGKCFAMARRLATPAM